MRRVRVQVLPNDPTNHLGELAKPRLEAILEAKGTGSAVS